MWESNRSCQLLETEARWDSTHQSKGDDALLSVPPMMRRVCPGPGGVVKASTQEVDQERSDVGALVAQCMWDLRGDWVVETGPNDVDSMIPDPG